MTTKIQCATCDSVRPLHDLEGMADCCRRTIMDLSSELNAVVIRLLTDKLAVEYGNTLADALIVSSNAAARAAARAWRNHRP